MKKQKIHGKCQENETPILEGTRRHKRLSPERVDLMDAGRGLGDGGGGGGGGVGGGGDENSAGGGGSGGRSGGGAGGRSGGGGPNGGGVGGGGSGRNHIRQSASGGENWEEASEEEGTISVVILPFRGREGRLGAEGVGGGHIASVMLYSDKERKKDREKQKKRS